MEVTHIAGIGVVVIAILWTASEQRWFYDEARELASGQYCSVLHRMLGGEAKSDTFFHQYYERRPVKLRHQGLVIGALTSEHILEALQHNQDTLSNTKSALKYKSSFSLVNQHEDQKKKGDFQPASQFLVMGVVNDISSIYTAQNYSLLVNSLQGRIDVLNQVSHSISMVHGRACDIQSYFSLPRQQAFDTHFDTEDKYVVQLEGSKSWDLWDPLVLLPLPEMGWALSKQEIRETLGSPQRHVIMNEGSCNKILIST